MRAQARVATLSDLVLPQAGAFGKVLREVLLVGTFVLFTAAAAQISIYLNPAVPITGQTLAVLLTGAVLGSRRGGIAMGLYVSAGAAGLPLLAPKGAVAFASWGYLLGFVAATFIVGLLAERGMDRRFRTVLLPMFVGNVVIYLFGLPWLAFFVPLDKVLDYGLYSFIPGDTLKLLIAAGVLPSAWAFVQRFR